MITPATYNNLPFFAGDDFSLLMNWKDSNGDLFNLTGWGGRLRFVVSPYQDIVLLEIDETNGITMGAATPNIKAVIDKSVTELVETAPLYYILEITDLTGVTSRLLQGTVSYKDLVDK